ncbi:MAG: tetratricopeptide repeat protein [Thiohalocapsa sp.]
MSIHLAAVSLPAAYLAAAIALAPAVGHAGDGALAATAQALAVAEAEHGKASPLLLPVLDRLAQQEARGGALAKAASLRRRALQIAVAGFGCDAAPAARAMLSLGLIEIDRRRYLDAEPMLILAQRVLAAAPEPDKAAMAAISAGLARIALARGEPAEAEHWARRAIATSRKRHNTPSEALRALAAALTAQHRDAEAERLLNAALAQDRRGSDDVATARTLSELANLRLREKRPRAALPLIEEATALDQTGLGPAHPFIADDLYDLGLVYAALHRQAAARRAFVATMAVLERGGGRNTPRFAYAQLELSRLDRERGDAADADALYRDARRILNKAEAEEHRRERKV